MRMVLVFVMLNLTAAACNRPPARVTWRCMDADPERHRRAVVQDAFYGRPSSGFPRACACATVSELDGLATVTDQGHQLVREQCAETGAACVCSDPSAQGCFIECPSGN